ncbi:MAG: CRISPR-associated protein Csx15 [Aggregatilineales bacterium]
MILLNFAHPLTSRQIEQIGVLAGQPPERVRDVKVQFDVNQPFVAQVVAMLDTLDISPADWQSGGWLIVLPSLNYIAAILLAELHGRMGHFPAILRLKTAASAAITEFEVAEIVNLETVRQAARTRR